MMVGTKNAETHENWVKDTLMSLPKGFKLLDAGAGETRFRKYCNHLEYVSQDLGEYDGKGNDSGLQTGNWDNSKLDIVSDICSIPVDDSSFDAILCTEVFEHIINPLEAINEFSRILKKDGLLIITAPFCSLTHFAPFHFYSGFNRYFYETALKDEYEIIDITQNGNYFEYLAQEVRRLHHMSKTYANTELRLWEKQILRPVLTILSRLSTRDNNSHQILSYGYFVKARKL